MLRRRKPLNIDQTSLRLRCGRNVLAKILFHLISDADKGSLCPNLFHGLFQTLGARAQQRLLGMMRVIPKMGEG